MAISAEFQAAMDRVDQETTELAEKFRELEAKLSTHMSPEDVATAKAFLTATADRLDAIGKKPEDPVPAGPSPELSFASRSRR